MNLGFRETDLGFGEKEDRSEHTRGWMGDGCREELLSLQNHEQESGAAEFVLLLVFGVGEKGGGSSDHAALVKDKPLVACRPMCGSMMGPTIALTHAE